MNGTFNEVYFQDLREPNQELVKVLALTDIVQVDVLDDTGSYRTALNVKLAKRIDQVTL